jgi:D-alanyl-D-alanine carboxypeptidase (penicillin-binding protein 5/6)
MTHNRPARTTSHRILRILLAGLLVVIAATAALGHRLTTSSTSTAALPTIDGFHRTHGGGLGKGLASTVRPAHRPAALPGSVWPAYGQAAVILTGQPRINVGPNQHAAPIASLAKVMTAYLVLRDHPLRSGQDGPTITLTDADVADTDRRAGQHESVVPVAAGEQLTEGQALEALLLPSANNIAAVLARWDAGSEHRFVDRMNATARSLGMAHTRYTDPSG